MKTYLLCFALLLLPTHTALAQRALTWQDLKEKFEASNPTLRAGQLNVDESRAQEITAFLRPNPDLSITADQFNYYPQLRPLAGADQIGSISYLIERGNKRALRKEVATKGTQIAVSQQEDLERNLLFTLRNAFVSLLQAKAVLQNAKENLAYYDHELQINRDRLKAGDIAPVDEDRLELQRAQFESDLETADVNLRTAKIQLLMLLNERTPVDSFDVAGPFEFTETLPSLEELRASALQTRPDLRAAMETVDQAKSSHRLAIANGTSDPIVSFDAGRNPPLNGYVGFGVTFPLRIFDKNQGEKLRTDIEVTRSQRLVDAARAQVFSDVDSAFTNLRSTVNLLRPYKSKYLTTAARVRDTVSFAYERGAATLLDFLDAQKSYRDTRLAYLNLIGSYLTAQSQLNLAIGREVLP